MTKVTNVNSAAADLNEQQLDQAVGGSIVMPDIVVHQADAIIHDSSVVVHQADAVMHEIRSR